MPNQAEKYLSPEEYLLIERNAETRSEYFEGETFAMAGASRSHNIIVANIIRVFGNQLIERPCNVYPSDMRVKVSTISKYVYPDITVTCGEEQFEDTHNDTLMNPLVITEVLSDTTEAYDRGQKFIHYQNIKSLSEYLLIAQKPYQAEQYVRQDDLTWRYSMYCHADDIIQLETIRCKLLLRDIYLKII